MKYLNIYIITTLILVNILTTFAFDFKNIIFGNQDNSNNIHNEDISFGFGVPAEVINRKPANHDCVNGYLCPDTHHCVSKPFYCPCRLETDIKCQLGKDWYTCIRGDKQCEQVIR
ncbi:unnamed protein product [Cunninghamella blakesleeana]